MLEKILYPIEFLMSSLLEYFYQLSHSYGLAIILLSISINFLLLPIYLLAEKLQHKEQKIQQQMRRKIDEIKECFIGQERFMMIQTLYKINKYHPVMGLRSIGSLLIQIPFFLVAYEFLKHYEGFASTSFLFIQELSQADALLSLGRNGINILPIIMTIINIWAAQIYTKRTNPEGIVSAVNMSIIFLVLLYNSPAALVLYWTCNNIFSLIKNVLLVKTSPKEQVGEITSSQSSFHIIKNRIIVWVSNKKKLIPTIIFLWALVSYLIISFMLIPNNRFQGAVPHALLNTAIVLLIISGLILLLSYLLHSNKTTTQLFYTRIGVVSTIFIAGISLFLYYKLIPIHKIDYQSVYFLIGSFICFAFANFLMLPYFYRVLISYKQLQSPHYLPPNKNPINIEALLVLLSAIASSLLVYVVLILEFYRGAPLEVLLPLSTIVKLGILYAFVSILIVMGLYLLVPRIVKSIIAYVTLLLALILLIYSLVIPFDFGRLNQFRLMQPDKIIPSYLMYLIEGCALILFGFFLFTWFQRNKKYLFVLLTIFIGVLIVKLGIFAMWVPTHKNNITEQAQKEDTINNPLEDQPLLFSFSKTKRNIAFILLDMANGGEFNTLIEEYPEITTLFNGFTWYPNTLSISTFTTSSVPSMIAGWQFSPENITDVEGDNLAQKIMSSYDYMFDTFLSYKYQISANGVVYYGGDSVQCSVLMKKNIQCLDYWDTSVLGYWLLNNQDENNKVSKDISTLDTMKLNIGVALMRSVPLPLKQTIYDDGNWHIFNDSFKNQQGFNWALKSWPLIDSLSTISKIRNEANIDQSMEEGTFTFIHSNITHEPYALDSSCKLQNDSYPDPSVDNNIKGKSSYYSLQCSVFALGRWIQWLKDNDIYNNTKIIIVSDHSNHFVDDPMNINNISPIFSGRESSFYFSNAHPLLLVKDFAFSEIEPAPLKTDNRFMSNADTAAIMYFGIANYTPPEKSLDEDKKDYTKGAIQERFLPLYHTGYYNWDDLINEKEQFHIKDKYIIHNNIFDFANWEKVK